MTFPLKENLIFFEEMVRQQRTRQFAPGHIAVPTYELDEMDKSFAREKLRELMDFYGYKHTKGQTTKCTEVFMPIEHGDYGKLDGALLVVTYFLSEGREFLSVSSRHWSVWPKHARALYNCKQA